MIQHAPASPAAAERNASEATVHVADGDPAMPALLRPIARSEGCRLAIHAALAPFLQTLDLQRPGCAVIALELPDGSGLDALRELAARQSQLPVVFTSRAGHAAEAVRALKLGCLDFVEKPFAPAAMALAIRGALEIDRQRRRLRQRLLELRARFAPLTPREREVMQLVVDGLHNRTIAARLGLSPKTVEVHRAHVMRKTGATSLPELVKLALAADVLPQPAPPAALPPVRG